ncbi:MAG: PAAR-like domain-containing protein [Myxococcota bacterium]
MFPVATKGGGVCLAAPDVCLVPPLPTPTPFVNVALCEDAVGTSAKVRACNKEVVTEASTIPMSSGNEPGVAGGVVSGVNLGPAAFVSFSGRVIAEGKKVVTLTSQTAQNGRPANCPGLLISTAQGKVNVGL